MVRQEDTGWLEGQSRAETAEVESWAGMGRAAGLCKGGKRGKMNA